MKPINEIRLSISCILEQIAHAFGLQTYCIFAAFGPTCWRRHKQSGIFMTLYGARRAANKLANTESYINVDYTVSTHRDGEELYRAKYKPNKRLQG